MKKLTLCLLLLLLPMVCMGDTYYIAKNGNDTNDGSSWDNAILTIDQLNLMMNAGDTAYFMATDKWYGSQITPPMGGDVDNQTYYISVNISTEYVPFGATICAGDSLGGGWSLCGIPSDSIYQRSYSPTLTTWDDKISAVLQGGSVYGDSIITAVGSLGGLDVSGKLYYDNINNVIYVRLFNLDGKQHPDAYNTISCTAPSFYITSSSQRYINSEGLNYECGAAGNIWFGFGSHSRYAIIRDGWIRYGCNRLASSNGALISSRRASDDVIGGNPATVQHIGMHNAVIACSLDYCADANSDQAWGIGMDVYSEWYLKIDSNYMGSHVNNTGFHFKGLYVYPPDASISNPGYQCSNNYIVTGDRVANAAIQMHATTNWTMIYGNIIECYNSRPIWVYLDDNHNTPNAWGTPLLIYNNTIYNQGTDGIVLGYSDAITSEDIDIRVKYNIFYNIDNNRNAIVCVHGSYQGITECDSNIYFDSTATLTYRADGGSTPIGSGQSYATWNLIYGFDDNSMFDNPEFNDVINGDFNRPNAPNEMNFTYGGIKWTKIGACQDNISIEPPDTTDVWVDTIVVVDEIAPLPDTINVGDCNGFDGIDMDDVIFLIDYIFLGGAAPPVYSNRSDMETQIWEYYIIDGVKDSSLIYQENKEVMR